MTRPRLLLPALLLMMGLASAIPAAAVIPPGFSDVVVLGTNSVWLEDDVIIVSGDVVVNDVATRPPLASNHELTVGAGASTPAGFAVKADRIHAHRTSSFGGDLFCNDLSAPGNPASCSPLTLPVFAFLPPFVTGPSGTDVAVRQDQKVELPPGDYGDLDLKRGATVLFTGGVYNFTSISTNQDCRLLFLASAELRVAESFASGHGSVIGPDAGSGVTAAQIVIYVGGADAPPGPVANLVTIQHETQVDANIYVPSGTLSIGRDSLATGAFLGLNVDIGRGTRVTLDTFFFNRPPVAGDDSATVAEGGSTSVLDSGETSLLANDSDPDGDNLSVSPTPAVAPAHGLVVLNPDGTFTYTHDGSETLSDSFVYEVCDDGVEPGPLCDTATVAITVTPVNDPPVANDDSATTEEDTPVTIDVAANDTDAEGGLDPTSTTATSTPAHGTLVNHGDGTFTYTPDLDFNGSDSFTYEICDLGADPPGVLCDTATVAITVTPVNDPPVANDDTTTVDQGGTVTVLDSGEASVLANDTDVDSVNLTATLVTAPQHASAFTFNPDGTFSYTDDGSRDPIDIFTYEVCDDGSPPLCDIGTVTVNVVAVSNTVADPQSVSTNKNTPVLITLTGSGDPPDLPLTFSIVTPPSNGTVTSPTFQSATSARTTYNPGLDFVGTDQFTFQVTDTQGFSATAVVTLEVIDEAGQEEITAFDLSVSTDQDTAVEVTLRASTTAAETVTFSIATSPANGTLSPVTPPAPGDDTASVTYTPSSGFTGTDSFTFEACISTACDTGTITITVRPVSIRVTVTKQGAGSGRVSSSPAGIDCGTICSAGFGSGETIQLLAVAEEGSVFSGWSGDADCADGRLTPNTDKNCTATFDLEGPPPVGEVLISVAVSGTGNGTVVSDPAGIDCGSVCSAIFDAFTRVDLIPTADPGSEFVGWAGSGDCLDGSLQTDRDASCIAIFDLLPTNTFNLTVFKAGNGDGTINSSPFGISCGGVCSADFEAGTAVTLSIRPDSGTFVGWTGDCDNTSAFFTTVTLDGDKTCTANFAN